MFRIVAKSKIQRPRVTDKNLCYEGSIALDPVLMSRADILPGELVQVVNVNTGARFETYAIAGKPGEVCLNGGTARLGEVGDELIIISYCLADSSEASDLVMKKVVVDARNRPRGEPPRRQVESGDEPPRRQGRQGERGDQPPRRPGRQERRASGEPFDKRR